MATSNLEKLMSVLKTVQDPDLRKDLVSLGMIRDIKLLDDGSVSFRVVLTTPACPVKAQLEEEIRQKLEQAGLRANFKMDAEVRAKAPAQSSGQTSSNSIPGVQHIIAVSSGKGGVGKSTIAVNLATSLALEGARVGLMDSDVYGPNIPTMMGVIEGPKVENDPVRGEIFLPPSAHGLKIMSMGFLVAGDQPLVWRGPMLHSIVNQFCHKVNWGELDYLVVDMPPGTGDVQLSLAQLVPVTGAVMVTTPQEVALQDVRKAFNMWDKVKIPVVGIVENMSYFKDDTGKKHEIFGQGGGRTLSEKFHVELLAEVPIVTRVRQGGDEGVPIVISEPKSEVALIFRDMARKVARQISILAAQQPDPSQQIHIGKFS